MSHSKKMSPTPPRVQPLARELGQLEGRSRALASIVETTPDGIVMTGLDGTIWYVNPGWEKMTGWSAREVVGKVTPRILKSDETDRGKYEELWRTILRGEIYRMTAVNRRKDGSRYHVEMIVAPLTDSTGDIEGFFAYERDVSERNRAAEAVRASEIRYRRLFEAARDGVLILDFESGAIVDANPFLIELLGFSRENLLDKKVWEIGAFKDIIANQDKFAELQKRGYVRYADLPLMSAEGRKIAVEFVSNVYMADQRKVIQCNIRDNTERKQAEVDRGKLEAQLIQSQKMEVVGRLAAGVAHDFNNILTAINGYSEFVRDALPSEDPRRADMVEILRAADRATSLTRQLLAFSRRQILSPENVDLNKIAGEMTNMLLRLIGEDVKLVTQLAPAPCVAKVDPGQIEQVIMNLAINARDAMPDGGEITLETELVTADEAFFAAHPDLRRGPLVCLRVRDTGCGMTDEVKSHVFEPFFTTKAKGKGTGLGLPTVFGIVKQSGGEIDLESASNSGTTFRIYFPQTETAVPEKEKKKGLPRGHEIVLLVEDEDIVRRIWQRILAANGYTVLTATNGREALKVLEHRANPVDVLVTDVVLPGMNGRELAQEIARGKMARRILFMSGFTDDAIVRHGVLEPGLAFIYKPFTTEGLLCKLREVLDGPADQAKA